MTVSFRPSPTCRIPPRSGWIRRLRIFPMTCARKCTTAKAPRMPFWNSTARSSTISRTSSLPSRCRSHITRRTGQTACAPSARRFLTPSARGSLPLPTASATTSAPPRRSTRRRTSAQRRSAAGNGRLSPRTCSPSTGIWARTGSRRLPICARQARRGSSCSSRRAIPLPANCRT